MTVLHVDDDPDFLKVARSFLELHSDRLRVVSARDADDGFDRLRDGSPPVECVLSDYNMPGTDGIELLQRVRETDPRVPFILYSGQLCEAVAEEAVERGADGCVPKDSTSRHFHTLCTRLEDEIVRLRAGSSYESCVSHRGE